MSAPTLSDSERAALKEAAVTIGRAGGGPAPLLLICEHAGNEVPAPWRDLGLAAPFLDTHFASDIGAGALTRLMAARLGAPFVLANYSRLFLDINRHPSDWDCLRPDMGGIPVPGNRGITAADKTLREAIARAPFDEAVSGLLAVRPAVVSVHSFTPVMAGKERATEIGVLWRKECRMGEPALETLRRHGGFVIGSNDPYDWHRSEGHSLARHGLDHGLACLYLEIRNDLLTSDEGRKKVADALAPALEAEIRFMDRGSPVTIEMEEPLPATKGSIA
jgi:predicted N-formylglutamate amidohydrolase